MIRYELLCGRDDAFEGWFRNSADFDDQAAAGLLSCPICGDRAVRKAVMAPAVLRTDRGDRAAQAAAFAAHVRQRIQETHEHVGARFPEEVRAIMAGDADDRPVWGEAKPEEVRALIEEGAPVAPIPAEFAPIPPRKLN